jgi:hypothetical protein
MKPNKTERIYELASRGTNTNLNNNNNHTGSEISEHPTTGHVTVNVRDGVAGELTDLMFRHQMRDSGKVESVRRRKRQETGLVETVKKLKEMSKVTSGALASESMYQFTPEMHALVKLRKEQAMALGVEQQAKRAEREQSLVVKRQAAQEKRLETGMQKMPLDDIKRLIASHKRNEDSPQKKNKPDLVSQLQRREVRDAEEKEANGVDLNMLSLRVLVNNLRVAGDADEESLLPKQKEELAAELVRRRNRRDTTVGTTTTLNNIL